MVKLVGFFLALFKGSLKGDVGAENGCEGSNTPAAMGLRMLGKFMSRVSFLTFLAESCKGCGCSAAVADNLLPFKGIMVLFPSLEMETAQKGVDGAAEVADSGEEDADVSETRGESKVELVVVGEDSVDSESNDGTLPQ